MPIYNFICECGNCFEQVVKPGAIKAYCGKCGSLANRDKKPTKSTFILKGTCWSKDNYDRTI